MTQPSFLKEDSESCRAEWQRVVNEQCRQTRFCIADRLIERTSEQLSQQHPHHRLEKLITRAVANRVLSEKIPMKDEEVLFNELVLELPQIVGENASELERDFGSFEISDEVVADCKWALEERARTGFRDRPLEGDYVAIYRREVVGSGPSETRLRQQLAAERHVDPLRFVVEYIGRGY